MGGRLPIMLTRCCAATLLALLMGCGDGSDSGADQPASTSSPTARVTEAPTATTSSEPASSSAAEPTKRGARIVASDSEFGQMLFDATGQAIYLFDVETTSKPRCYDACAEAWPPVLTTGGPVSGPGVESSLLGTTKRADGTVQVTYNDHPLYFYANEGKREVKCHDIFLNGGNWYIVQPGGDPAPAG
jgi:predicted lipoprotein with Yx(FWY)xxD motif